PQGDQPGSLDVTMSVADAGPADTARHRAPVLVALRLPLDQLLAAAAPASFAVADARTFAQA
ncbi:MAG: hypothetical protein ACR2JM_09950, partial [Mycobacterium sp.]